MRTLNFGQLPQPMKLEELVDFMRRALAKLEEHSQQYDKPLPNIYTFTNTTVPLRTLNAATATTANIVNFIATYFSDLAERGMVNIDVS
jgi:hypothetical protein